MYYGIYFFYILLLHCILLCGIICLCLVNVFLYGSENKMGKATMNISPAFDNFIFDWDYEKYAGGKKEVLCLP